VSGGGREGGREGINDMGNRHVRRRQEFRGYTLWYSLDANILPRAQKHLVQRVAFSEIPEKLHTAITRVHRRRGLGRCESK